MTTRTPARLHHLALTVSDVDASVPWYENVFGEDFYLEVQNNGLEVQRQALAAVGDGRRRTPGPGRRRSHWRLEEPARCPRRACS